MKPPDVNGVEQPTAHAAHAGDTAIATDVVERARDDSGEPLYDVQDRRYSGEWRSVAQTHDVHEARRIALLIRWAGGSARVEMIPRPIIP